MFNVIEMRGNMRRPLCAVHIKRGEDRLYNRKHNGIRQIY